MVTVKMSTYLVLLSFTLLLVSCSRQGHAAQVVIPHLQKVFHSTPSLKELHLQGVDEEVNWKGKNSRRLMIGSTAPICTYNECKGCKHKCRAEQIPVDANDPINSAYHYRCVCHR